MTRDEFAVDLRRWSVALGRASGPYRMRIHLDEVEVVFTHWDSSSQLYVSWNRDGQLVDHVRCEHVFRSSLSTAILTMADKLGAHPDAAVGMRILTSDNRLVVFAIEGDKAAIELLPNDAGNIVQRRPPPAVN